MKHEVEMPVDRNSTSVVIINDGTETGVVNLYDISFDRLMFNVSDISCVKYSQRTLLLFIKQPDQFFYVLFFKSIHVS